MNFSFFFFFFCVCVKISRIMYIMQPFWQQNAFLTKGNCPIVQKNIFCSDSSRKRLVFPKYHVHISLSLGGLKKKKQLVNNREIRKLDSVLSTKSQYASKCANFFFCFDVNSSNCKF